MKQIKQIIKFFMIMVFIFIPTFLFGCDEKPVAVMTLDTNNYTINIGEEVFVSVSLSNISGELIWECNDKSVATVDDGTILGISEGSATVKVSLGTLSQLIYIEVIDPNKERVYRIEYELDDGILPSDAITEYTEKKVTILPTPTKENYIFDGWNIEGSEEKIVQIEANFTGNIKVEANWILYDSTNEGIIDNAIEDFLLEYTDFEIDKSIELINTYKEEIELTWISKNPEIITNNGKFIRPYTETSVVFAVTFKLKGITKETEVNMIAKGYKDLTSPIASSYIYRNFSSVNDEYFETLDIITCAFITANESGNLSGSNFLNNCTNYIIPKAHEKGCYVILSIAPSSKWDSLVIKQTTMDTFASNIVKMINAYSFDGVDLDWECPTYGQKTLFTQLVKTVREKVKENNPAHLVTAAIGGGKWQPPYYDLTNSAQYLDYINMMTYGAVSNTGYYQNALFPNKTKDNPTFNCGHTLTSCSISESVEIYNNLNVPNNKIIVGLAFYAVKQTRETTSDSWANGKSVLYNTMLSTYLNNSDYTYYYDKVAQVPYLVKNDGLEFISYDDETSIKAKCKYVITQGLAGAMHWESGCDVSGTLLRAVKEGFNK